MWTPLQDILRLLFPATCYHCGKELVGGERYLCLNCQFDLPLTNYSAIPNNETELRIGGKIPIKAGTSLLYYQNEMCSKTILHQIKYFGHYKMAIDYGKMLGKEIAQSGRFDDVDFLIPVPLHWRKKWKRGYNQSELLCRGIREHFDRPICTRVLYRKRYTQTQTRKSHEERLENMKDVFAVRNIKELEGKHILLIDDVITTGATSDSCWNALKSISGIRISIASLAIATNH